MKTKQIVLWIMAGVGVILMYSAYHNVSPTSLLAKYAGLSSKVSPLTSISKASSGNPLDIGGTPGGSNSKGQAVTPWGQSGGTPDNPQTYGGIGKAVQLDPYSNEYVTVDSNGYSQGAIPAGYQASPGTYISDGTIAA